MTAPSVGGGWGIGVGKLEGDGVGGLSEAVYRTELNSRHVISLVGQVQLRKWWRAELKRRPQPCLVRLHAISLVCAGAA